MKRQVDTVLIVVLCLVVSLSAAPAGIPEARAEDTGFWTVLNTGFTNAATSLAFDPLIHGQVYAGTGGAGIFYCYNGDLEQRWAKLVEKGNLGSDPVWCLAVAPVAPTTLYADGNAVCRITFGGNPFVFDTSLPDRGTYSIVVDPLAPTTIYVAQGSWGVYRSTDSGATWRTLIPPGDPNSAIESLAIDPATPATLYGTAGGRVFRSTDRGGNWTELSPGPTQASGIDDLAIDPLTPTTLYVGGDNGVFRSADSGSTWIAVSNGLTTLSVKHLVIDPATPTTLYASTYSGGIFQSRNSGGQWTAINTGLPHKGVISLAIDPNAPYTLLAGLDNTGIFRFDPSTPRTLTTSVTPLGSGSVGRSPEAAYYGSGSTTTLTATSVAGWHFVDWSGDLTGQTNPVTVSMDANKTISANFAINTYTVTPSCGAGGSVSPATSMTVDYGSSLSFAIAPSSGYHVEDVLVDGVSVGAVSAYTFVNITANRSISASFAINRYALSVNVSGSGSVAKTPDQAAYDHGTSVQLTATPSIGSLFTGWTGDAIGTNNPLTVTMEANKNITATFVPAFTLSVAASPTAGGAVTRNPEQSTYASGSGVQLTAVPATGYVFSGWFGDITGMSNPIVVSMTANRSVSASFTALANEYSLVVMPSPFAGGSVTKTPDQEHYTSGSVVHLVPAPAAGYTFTGWSGDASGATNPLIVTMDRSRFITAKFTLQAPQTYAVAVSVTGQGTVARTPDSSAYAAGTSVQLMAAPAAGWRFIGWTGDVSGVANPATLVVSRAHTVTAQFEPTAPTLTSSLHAVVVGEGAVVRSPDRSLFDPIETVELRAVPATGWAFTRWEGDLSGTTPTMRLPMTTSKAVVAVFELLPEEKKWSVIISSGTDGTVAPPGTQTVNDGGALHIELQPNVGYGIDKLLVDGISVTLPSKAAQSYDLGPVTTNRQLHCTFKAIQVLPDTHVVRLTIGSTWLTIDGEQTALDAAPVIQNSRTLLPIRAIVEAFGGTIEWYADLRVVTMYLNGRQVSLQIGNPQGFVDGVQKPLDVADPKVVPIIISGRTFLPLRFVAENLGLQVEWNAVTRTVTVQG